MGADPRIISPDALVARRAAEQHGVVSLAQLSECGLDAGAVNFRVRAGRLHRMHRGVFAVGHTRLSRKGHWMAAVLACADGAALSHTSAAALWGLRMSSATRIHVTVPTTHGQTRRNAIAIHRSGVLAAEEVTAIDGIPVTSVARTLLDIAGMLASGALERAVERSLSLRLFDLTQIRAVIDANPRRRGASNLTRIIATIHDEPTLPRSKLENLMRDLCDAHGFVRPDVNAIVEGVEVDFFGRSRRLIVETDGYETHGTRAAFERDRAKDARLTMLGYRVIRFTHRRLTRDRQTVAATLQPLLAGV